MRELECERASRFDIDMVWKDTFCLPNDLTCLFMQLRRLSDEALDSIILDTESRNEFDLAWDPIRELEASIVFLS